MKTTWLVTFLAAGCVPEPSPSAGLPREPELALALAADGLTAVDAAGGTVRIGARGGDWTETRPGRWERPAPGLDGAVEWWRLHGDRPEHGFTLPTAGEELVVHVAIDADVRPDARGGAILARGTYRYGAPVAFDATGRRIPAWMLPERGGVALHVDARDAVAPILLDPTLTAYGWVSPAGSRGDRAGASVLVADVQGDGVGDLLVGAPGAGGGGTVRVSPGRVGLLGAAPSLSFAGDPGDELGQALVTGDFDGDGYQDLAAGAPGRAGVGGVYVVPGGVAGLDVAGLTVLAGEGGAFGQALATGDVNGDGFDELVVGAPTGGDDVAGEGRIHVYAGSAVGLASPPTVIDMDLAQQLGGAVALLDADGDGFDDLLAGASGWNGSRGKARLWRGGAAGLAAAPTWEATGAGFYFSDAVAAAGDVNGDGYEDALVGSASDDGARLYLGSAAGLGAVESWSATPSGASFAAELRGAGDLDADGFADFAVGDPGAGRVWVWRGGPSGPDADPTWLSVDPQRSASAGAALAFGDLTGDGRSELVVGAPAASWTARDAGRVQVVYGVADGFLAEAPPEDQRLPIDAGTVTYEVVLAAGDFDGDGDDDLAVGAEYAGVSQRGVVSVHDGTPTGVAGSPRITHAAPASASHYGHALAVTDVDRDGDDDLVVGAPEGGVRREGAVYLHEGGPGSLGPIASTFAGGMDSARMGESLAALGDFDGDGFDDVAAGCIWCTGGEDLEGHVRLLRGTAAGLVQAWSFEANVERNQFGKWVGGGGDVNGDGYADLLVGDDDATWLLPGAPVARPVSAGVRLVGWDVDGGLLTDTNGDGHADVVLGGPTDDLAAAGGGQVSLYPGGPQGLGPVTPAADTPWGEAEGRPFVAGDWDGDGAEDLGLAAGYASSPLRADAARIVASTPGGLGSAMFAVEGHTLDPEASPVTGDFDGDGLRDLALASASLDGHTSGEVRLWYGAPRPVVLALDDTFETTEDVALGVPAPGALANDAGASAAVLLMPPLHGEVELAPDGGFVYTPDPQFEGTDVFRYVALGGAATSHVASVTILVAFVNDPPEVLGDPTPRTVTERVPVLVGASARDPERYDLRVTVTAAGGVVRAPDVPGVAGDGRAGASLFLTGDHADVVEALEQLEFAGTTLGPATVTVEVDDYVTSDVEVFPFDVVP